MDVLPKIVANHKVKSDQVRVLKGKLKNSISKEVLRNELKREKSREVNSSHFMGFYGFDDKGYEKECNEIEARIQLLEELLYEY